MSFCWGCEQDMHGKAQRTAQHGKGIDTGPAGLPLKLPDLCPVQAGFLCKLFLTPAQHGPGIQDVGGKNLPGCLLWGCFGHAASIRLLAASFDSM